MFLFGLMLLILLGLPFTSMWVSFFNANHTWEDARIFTNFITLNTVYAFAIAVVFGGLLR
ncbi:hypothetical protein D3C71_1277550 [compost metagenome]